MRRLRQADTGHAGPKIGRSGVTWGNPRKAAAMEATPRPWKAAGKLGVVGVNGKQVAQFGDEEEGAFENAAENRELAIRAVNAHDGFVEACEAARDGSLNEFGACRICHTGRVDHGHHHATGCYVPLVESALAAAKPVKPTETDRS